MSTLSIRDNGKVRETFSKDILEALVKIVAPNNIMDQTPYNQKTNGSIPMLYL